jgi:hypothetical protein
MFTLKNINVKQFEEFVNNPDKHIESFVSTFEDTVEKIGADTFAPMLTIFSDLDNIEITIQCREYEDKDDMYKSLNEMLQFYSATEAHSFIFAMDIRQTTYSQQSPATKVESPTDALSLTFASQDSSGMLIMPYEVIDNKVIWNSDKFDVSTLANDDPSKTYQGEIAELFYLMTHLNGPLFTPAQLLNYYNFKGYNFIFPSESHLERIIKVQI